MKTLLHIVVYIFILMGLSGCNSDVFVEDFQPSVSDVTLEGNGDSVTIRFKSSNWDPVSYTHLTLPTNSRV